MIPMYDYEPKSYIGAPMVADVSLFVVADAPTNWYVYSIPEPVPSDFNIPIDEEEHEMMIDNIRPRIN